jgi:hypothetical protein
MRLDPHKRAETVKRAAELNARLRILAHDSSVTDRAAQSFAVQREMGELLRALEADDSDNEQRAA